MHPSHGFHGDGLAIDPLEPLPGLLRRPAVERTARQALGQGAVSCRGIRRTIRDAEGKRGLPRTVGRRCFPSIQRLEPCQPACQVRSIDVIQAHSQNDRWA